MKESSEMYLESILILSKERPFVRAIDVSEYMGFSKQSVSRAVGLLKEGGFLNVEQNGNLLLTDSGTRLAEKIYARHTLLSEVLIKIGVDEKTASEDACKIEHDISDETFDALRSFLEKTKN